MPLKRAHSQPDLGTRLLALRREHGYSLAEVAKATGISKSFLSLVENGESDITISRLIRLVDLYRVGVGDLLPTEAREGEGVVRKGEERKLISSTENIEVMLLAPDSDRQMMPFIAIFDEGGKEAEHVSHQGEEFVHVLEGAIIVEVDGASPVTLLEGDSFYFRADRGHSYRNSAKGRSRLYGAVTPPWL